jgi:hypothetical protein
MGRHSDGLFSFPERENGQLPNWGLLLERLIFIDQTSKHCQVIVIPMPGVTWEELPVTGTLLRTMLVVCLMVGFIPGALADYYKYTDASGAVTMTNKLDTVPQRYRSRLKVIREDAPTKQNPGARKEPQAEPVPEESSSTPQAAAAPAPAPQGRIAQLSARYIWFEPLLYLAGFFAALLVVIKLASLVPSAGLSKLIYLSFFLGVGVFLYQAHVRHVVEESLAVKEKAVNMVKKSNMTEIQLPGEELPPEKK